MAVDRHRSLLAGALLAVLFVSASCVSIPEAQETAGATDPEPTPLAEPTAAVSPQATEPPAVAASPEPTATARPEPATPNPTLTPAPPTPTPGPVDDTPVVIDGDGWTITEATVERLVAFIEEIHELEFTDPVEVLVEDDIGAEIGPGFEPFPETEWSLLRLLGIVDEDLNRDDVNQLRRDRVRGVCCGVNDNGDLTITVESQTTQLETEAIVVHELTHALHRQHEYLGRSRPRTTEYPAPASAATEGVPQLVAFAWVARADPALAAEVQAELAIIPPDLQAGTGTGAERILEFAYGTAPAAFDPLFAERGADLLFDLLDRPPETTEQVLFPQKWLDDEEPVGVREPVLADGVRSRRSGTLGAALLMMALVEATGEPAARNLVAGWTGGTWSLYRSSGGAAPPRDCLAARIAMDTRAEAEALADALGNVLWDDESATPIEVQETRLPEVVVLRLDVC